MSLMTTIVIVTICVPFMMATFWAVTDVAQKDFGTPRRKIIWWVIASVPFVGFLVYLIGGYRQGKKI